MYLPNHILLVEKDANLAALVKENLMQSGFESDWCQDAAQAIEKHHIQVFDVCILGLQLSDPACKTLINDFRKPSGKSPVILLSADAKEARRAHEAGCMAFLTRPFTFRQLSEAIRQVMIATGRSWQNPQQSYPQLSLGTLQFNYAQRRLFSNTVDVRLTQREAELLYVLAINKDSVLDRETILKAVWDKEAGEQPAKLNSSLQVYVNKLRRVLRCDPSLELRNIHGQGYRLIEKPVFDHDYARPH